MSFRLRLTALASLAVAVAVIGVSFVVYYTDRHELISQVDSDLSESRTLSPLNAVVGIRTDGNAQVAQSVTFGRGGKRVQFRGPQKLPPVFNVVLPRSSTAVQVRLTSRNARATPSKAPPRFSTTTIKGVPTRVLTLLAPQQTVTISRSLLDVDRNLDHLRWLLVFICLGGIGAAAILGALVSGRAMAPLRRLTETTERIIDTGALSERTGQRGRDEISRLSTRLDELLATLEQSLRAQRQLVADASHELRTPITTLRANF